MSSGNQSMNIVVVEDDSTVANTAENWHSTQHVHRRPNVHTNTPPKQSLEVTGSSPQGEVLLTADDDNKVDLVSSSADLRSQESGVTQGLVREEDEDTYELPPTAVLKHLLKQQNTFFAQNQNQLPAGVLVGVNGGGRQPSSAALAIQNIGAMTARQGNNLKGTTSQSAAAATAIFMSKDIDESPFPIRTKGGKSNVSNHYLSAETPHAFEFSVEVVDVHLDNTNNLPPIHYGSGRHGGDVISTTERAPHLHKDTNRSQLIAGSVIPSRFLRRIRTQWDSRKELQELLIRFRESITCIHSHATTHFHLWEEALYEIYSVTGSTRSKIRARLPKRAWQKARDEQQKKEREELRLKRIKEGTWLYSADEEEERLRVEQEERENPPLPDAEHVERASKLFERAIRRCGDIFEELATHIGGFGDRFIQLMRMINAEVAAIDWLNSFEDMLEIFETQLPTFHNDSLLDFAMEVPPIVMDGTKLTVSELNCFSAEAKREKVKTNEVIPEGMAISLKTKINFEEHTKHLKDKISAAPVVTEAAPVTAASVAHVATQPAAGSTNGTAANNKRGSSAPQADGGSLERRTSTTASEVSTKTGPRGSRKGLDVSNSEGKPPRRSSTLGKSQQLATTQQHQQLNTSSNSHTNSPSAQPADATPPPPLLLASSMNTSASTSFSTTATATTLRTGVVQNRHLAALDGTSQMDVVAKIGNQLSQTSTVAEGGGSKGAGINKSKYPLVSALPYRCEIVASAADHTDPFLRTLYVATSSGAVLSMPFSNVASLTGHADGQKKKTSTVEDEASERVKAAIATLLTGYPFPLPTAKPVPSPAAGGLAADGGAFGEGGSAIPNQVGHRRSSASDLASNDGGHRRGTTVTSATKRNSATGSLATKDPKAAAKSERQRKQEEAAAAIAAEKEAAAAAANAIKAEAAARLPIKPPPTPDPKTARPTYIDGVRLFEGHMYEVHLLEYIPAVNILVSASKDKTMRLHNATTGRLINVIADLKGLPSSVCYHRDLEAIVVGSYSGEIVMLDPRTKGCVGKMKLSQPVHSLCFDAVLSVLFVGTRKGHVYGFKLALDPQHYRPRLEPIDDEGQLQDCVYCFLPNATDPLAYPVDRSTCTITVQVGDHNTDSSTNGTAVALNSPMNAQPPSIISNTNVKNAVALNAPITKMVSVAFYLFVGDAVGRVQQWDLASGEYVRKYHTHSDDITDIIVTVDGILFTASKDALVIVWSIVDGSRLRVINRHYSGVSGMFVGYLGGSHTPDGQEENRENVQLPSNVQSKSSNTTQKPVATEQPAPSNALGSGKSSSGGDGANPAAAGHGYNIFTHRRLNGAVADMFEEEGGASTIGGGASTIGGNTSVTSPNGKRGSSAAGSRSDQSPVADSRVVPSAPMARPFLMIPGYEDQPSAGEGMAAPATRPKSGEPSQQGWSDHPNSANVGIALLRGEVPTNVDMRTLLGSRECVRLTVHNPPVLVTMSMDESIVTWAVQYNE